MVLAPEDRVHYVCDTAGTPASVYLCIVSNTRTRGDGAKSSR